MATRGHHEIFYAGVDHLWPLGNRRSEGEKRCIRKIIGAKTGKFGQHDKVRTVGMATALKLKIRASDIFVCDEPSVGTNIHRVAAVCNCQDTFFRHRCPGRLQRWWYLAIPVGTKQQNDRKCTLKYRRNWFCFLEDVSTSSEKCAPTVC
jgi:hypothetical protein